MIYLDLIDGLPVDEERLPSRESSFLKFMNENIANLDLRSRDGANTLNKLIFANDKIIQSFRSSIENTPEISNDNISFGSKNQRNNFVRDGLLPNQKLYRAHSLNNENKISYPSSSPFNFTLSSPSNNRFDDIIDAVSPEKNKINANILQNQNLQQVLSVRKTQLSQKSLNQELYDEKLTRDIMSAEHKKFENLNNKSSNSRKMSPNNNNTINIFRSETSNDNNRNETKKNENIENKSFVPEKELKNGKTGNYISQMKSSLNNACLPKSRSSSIIGDFSFNQDCNDLIVANTQRSTEEGSPNSKYSAESTINHNLMSNNKERLGIRSITRNNSIDLSTEKKKNVSNMKHENINAIKGQMVINLSTAMKLQNSKTKRKVMVNKALGSKFTCNTDNECYDSTLNTLQSVNELKNNEYYQKKQLFKDEQRFMQQTSYFPNIAKCESYLFKNVNH